MPTVWARAQRRPLAPTQSNNELEAFKKETKPKIKLLRSAMPAKPAAGGKDEV